MSGFERFILENAEADIPRLLLSCREWPYPDDPALSFIEGKELAVNTIESRKKLARKVPEWYARTSLVYPSSLSAEQCSSSVTAEYKAGLAVRIAGSGCRIADLTGGLGVDAFAFSKVASDVLYNDMDSRLASAARHNFRELSAGNIHVRNLEVGPGTIEAILCGFNPDIIFLDPARRASDGSKVFFLEDCSPDVLRLVPELFGACRHILLKLSPMADISLSVEKLNRSYEEYLEKTEGTGWNGKWVREVHVVSARGECKELLVWMDREWNGDPSITCREDGGTIVFDAAEISASVPVFPESTYMKYLFEPGKSLAKAGVSNALCRRFGLVKLARSTNLFAAGEPDLFAFGKVYEVEEVMKMDRRAFKEVGKRYPCSEVSARNIPLTSEELRSRLGVKSGDDAHIFGVRIETPFESGNFLLVCHRL